MVTLKLPAGKKQEVLLSPYSLTMAGPGYRFEVGRFSYAVLARAHMFLSPDDDAALRVGAFCEFSTDAMLVIGGEHRNDSLFNVTFGASQTIKSMMDHDNRRLAQTYAATSITIGDNVILSKRAIVLDGATVGSGCVIAAGAIVTSECALLGIYGGIPARRLRDRFPEGRAEIYTATRWWDVHAHDLVRLPLLLNRLERGEITLDDFRGSVGYLHKRPVVHLACEGGQSGGVAIKGVSHYTIDGTKIDDTDTVTKLNRYFAQGWDKSDTLQWSPDIFHAMGLV